MWILILTIAGAGYSNSTAGVAVATVSGFTTETSCLAAANSWLKQPRSGANDRIYHALCAKA